MKKTLVFDIDGTLFTSYGTILEESKSAILEASKQGYKIILASGRPTDSLKLLIMQLPVKPIYLLGSNGGEVFDVINDKIINENVISSEFINMIMQKEFIRKLKTVFHRPTISSAFNLDAADFKHLQQFSFGGINTISLGDILKMKDCSMIALDVDKTPLSKENEIWLKKQAALNDLSVIKMDGYLDIFPGTTSKGEALIWLEKQGLIDSNFSYTFGDGLNDVEMHSWAKYSYAMENAHPEIKDIATKTIGHHDTTAIADTILEIIK